MSTFNISTEFYSPPVGPIRSSHHVTLNSRGNPFSDKKSVIFAQQKYIDAGIPLDDITIVVANTW